MLDLRVSTVPTINGEKIVMRVLDKETMLLNLEDLGLSTEDEQIFKALIDEPYGMILVTGPTGSGKTTTLYAVLNCLDSITRNIVTIENPVEYELPNISQIQVNPSAGGVTFATALRAILRQDPDVIIVGEIRDLETAKTAIQAALTGHLVFGTLHTNDAPSTISRLLDMGMESFLVSFAVIGVVAQRLVRNICPDCKEHYQPSQEILDQLALPVNEVAAQMGIDLDEIRFSRGRGCKFCFNTGYQGRSGIFEVLRITENIRRLIIDRAPADEIKKAAMREGMKTLQQRGLEKILQGVSTVEEIKSVTNI
jgi:type II secretory ATPase GspE/PulE/Tfp pilus assembly ATPase PilB-like protein